MRNYLPAQTELSQGFTFCIRAIFEQFTMDHCVEQPVPILFSHVRNKPGDAFAVEADLFSQSGLDKEVS